MAQRFDAAGRAVWDKLQASIGQACADMDQEQRVAFWHGLGHAAHEQMVACAGEPATRALLQELLQQHHAAG